MRHNILFQVVPPNNATSTTVVPPPEAERRQRWRAQPMKRERAYTAVRPEPEVPEFLRNPSKPYQSILGTEDFSTYPDEAREGRDLI